jgi:4-oxalocrotonate tautomerase
MPHVHIKLWPGKSESRKQMLTKEVTQAIMTSLGYGEDSVSVRLEEIASGDWTEKVYKPDILGGPGKLYKSPGYNPL